MLNFAHNDTGRGRRLANFLLAWWDAEADIARWATGAGVKRTEVMTGSIGPGRRPMSLGAGEFDEAAFGEGGISIASSARAGGVWVIGRTRTTGVPSSSAVTNASTISDVSTAAMSSSLRSAVASSRRSRRASRR
ncbi:hypothetical protein [Sinorhizobium meliloti]|uniref:hypothetical protein n=1 Tax=Rhizobium meliloti TaxID=382 RepID=UPI003F7333E3